MENEGGKRWDRDPFAERPPVGPAAELHVVRLSPKELSGKLDMIPLGGKYKEIHPLHALGLEYGGDPATYSLSLRDLAGRGRQQTFFNLGLVTLREFGEPKIPMELELPSDAPAPPSGPPAAPKESSMPNPPFVPQTMFEAAGAGGGESAFTQTVLRMYERQSTELAQLRQAEATRELAQFRAEVTREFSLMRADVAKVAETLKGVVDSITKGKPPLDITSVEHAADTISRFEQMAPVILRNGGAAVAAAAPAPDEGAEDRLGEILATVQGVSGAVRDVSAAMQAIAPLLQNLRAGVPAPAQAPAEATVEPPRPAGRAQFVPQRYRGNGNGHASAPEPDAGT